ncbi:sensor histidine kinase [Treponema socranskii]|uniref:sensor histidine kinase n=1 Tax=Treponema socranskii TaxID=53419 RepID=UPI00287135D7|nr:histidine kinase [Treponema socranskii]MDR9859671.1 histidine kinase [Treponema socranskii]
MQRFNSISIRIFIFLSSLVIIICMLFLVIGNIYWKKLKKQNIRHHLEITNTTKEKLNIILESLDDTMYLTKNNNAIVSYVNSPGRKHNEREKIKKLFEHIVDTNIAISRIHCICKDDYICSIPDAQNTDTEAYYTIFHRYEKSGSYENTWLYIQKKLLFFSPLFDDVNRSFFGVIIFEISYPEIYRIFIESSIKINDKALIIDENNNIVLYYPVLTDYKKLLNHDVLSLPENSYMESSLYSKPALIVSSKLYKTNWKLIRFIPISSALEEFNSIFFTAKYFILILICIIILYTLILTQTITKPIAYLSDICDKVAAGNLYISSKLKRNDELGKLSETINAMLEQIRNLFIKEQKNQQEKLQMELQVLQSQINPHFLYNSLENIKQLALLQGTVNIAECSSALISVLRYNMNTKYNANLEDEIKNVQNYLTVQKYRASVLFKTKTKIPKNTKNCMVLRFMLQPLIENTIYHGFTDYKRDDYFIQIISSINNDTLIIEIIDNGEGMSKDIQNKLNKMEYVQNKSTQSLHNIGIRNVQTRIQLYFGQEYGLYFYKNSFSGTTVRITLPYKFST